MKLTERDTDTTLVGRLTPADVRALHDKGVESALQPDDGEGGEGGSGDAESVPTDVEPEPDDGDQQEGGGSSDGSATDSDDAGAPPAGDDAPDEDGEDADDPLADADADALDDAADAMDDTDPSDWLNTGDDYSLPDEDMERKYEQLRKEVQKGQTDIAKEKAKRDRRVEKGRSREVAEFTKQKMEENGMAKEVEEAFKQIKTQDMPEPVTEGERLHVRNYVRHRAGDYAEQRLYEEDQPIEDGDRCVGVALDMSGSMRTQTARMAMAAIGIATRTIGDDLAAMGYRTAGSFGANKTELIAAPDETFRWDNVNAVHCNGNTPTAAGVRDTVSLLEASNRREKVLIVVTDGKANRLTEDHPDVPSHKRSDVAKDEAAEYVGRARSDGIKVIGLGVGGAPEEMMREIFGPKGYVMARMDDMADALVRAYSRQMNIDMDW